MQKYPVSKLTLCYTTTLAYTTCKHMKGLDCSKPPKPRISVRDCNSKETLKTRYFGI